MDEIARLQMKATQGPQKLDCFRVAFDIEKLSWELHYFLKHFLEGHRGCDLTVEDRATLSEAFHELSREIASWPRVLCHRDYHSRNLMQHAGRLYWIDFQDARMGPSTYDLASLLRDAYVDVPEELQEDAQGALPADGDAGRAARGLPPPLRPHVRAAEPEGARDVRLHGHGAAATPSTCPTSRARWPTRGTTSRATRSWSGSGARSSGTCRSSPDGERRP